VVVTVNSAPTASVSGGGTICSGGSSTVSAALTGAAPFSITWSDGFSQNVSGTTATRTVSPSSNTTYTITSITDANCSGTSSGSATVTVNGRPSALVSGGGAICPGASATVSAILSGIAPFSVTWSDGFTQNNVSGTSVSRTVSPSSNTTYTITSMGDANCSGTSSGSATVTIKVTPSATVSGGGTVCAGASSTINATLTGAAPFSITWSDGVVQNFSANTASRSVSPSATTTYTITSVSDANCSGTSSGSATVTVNTLPAFTQPPNRTIPKNTSTTLTVSPTGTAPFTYQWYKGAYPSTTNPVSTQQTYTTPNLTKGTYTYWVRVTNTCGSTSSATITITTN